MMIRCAAPNAVRRSGAVAVPPREPSPIGSSRVAPDADGVLDEFNQPAAAYRMVRLLAAVGVEARVDKHCHGARHRYEVHRVVVTASGDVSGDAVPALLLDAWRWGCGLLSRSSERTLVRWQRRDRRVLAVAAWRAALLAAGRRRGATLTLRLADAEATAVLVGAARLMGVQVRVQARPGHQLVSVDPDAEYGRLFAVVGNTGPAGEV